MPGDLITIPDNLEDLSSDDLFIIARGAGVVLKEGNTRESLIRQLRRMAL